jgi:hypothetical protein
MCRSLLEKLSERWGAVEEALTADRAALEAFVQTLRQRASGKWTSDGRCEAEAVRLLVKVAVSRPEVALPAVAALLREYGSEWECREIAGDMLAEYNTLAPRLGRDASLAAELADALVALLGEVAPPQRYLPAVELLTRLAQDNTGLRKGIAERAAAILRDRDWGDHDLKSSLDGLAQAVDFQEEPQEPVPEEPEKPSLPAEVLDNMVILPDAPLKTLAEYCAFLKAMGTAANPMAVITSFGMTAESWVDCVRRWGEVICGNNDIALRYALLMTPEGPSGVA